MRPSNASSAGAPAFQAMRCTWLTSGSHARARATPQPPPPVPVSGLRRSRPLRPRRRRISPRPRQRARATRPGGSAGPGCGAPRHRSAGRQRTPPTRSRGRQTLPPVLREMPGRRTGSERPDPRSSTYLRGQPRPALRAPSRQDRPSRPGPHPHAETVLAVTTAVVRFVGSLRHRDLPQSSRSNQRRPGGSRSISEVVPRPTGRRRPASTGSMHQKV